MRWLGGEGWGGYERKSCPRKDRLKVGVLGYNLSCYNNNNDDDDRKEKYVESFVVLSYNYYKSNESEKERVSERKSERERRVAKFLINIC